MAKIDRDRLPFLLFLLPATLWLILFFLLPLGLVLVYSFLPADGNGSGWTLENYRRAGDWLYLGIFWRSLGLGFLSTLACLLIGYPLAFFIATRADRWRNALLLLIIIPFWTNFLVRTYAWMVILRGEGVINSVLMGAGAIDRPLDLLFTPIAVAVGLIYGYLPFMVLPIYSTLERFDFRLVEAAQDLGADDGRAFWRIVFPLTARGTIAGCLLVFIPSVTAFITPDILGGAKTMMVGNLIQNQFLKSLNWPFGSALSILLIALIVIPIVLYFQLTEDRERVPAGKGGDS